LASADQLEKFWLQLTLRDPKANFEREPERTEILYWLGTIITSLVGGFNPSEKY
jgi:hypothetical protein